MRQKLRHERFDLPHIGNFARSHGEDHALSGVGAIDQERKIRRVRDESILSSVEALEYERSVLVRDGVRSGGVVRLHRRVARVQQQDLARIQNTFRRGLVGVYVEDDATYHSQP